jgi:hypothetical protein
MLANLGPATGQSVAGGSIDPLEFGASCGSADSTAGIQAAVNQAVSQGGTVIISCPMTVAGQVNIGSSGRQGGIRITGAGPMYYSGMTDIGGPVDWPPSKGPAIICTSTSAQACLMVNAAGVEIDHINFGNIQPVPPDTGTWNPTVYPFVIGTVGTSGWQGLNIHDVVFTATSNAIDLEGTRDYAEWSGTQIAIDNIWCNPCLNTGIRVHRIDNQLMVSRFGTVPSGFYMGKAPLGAYLRQNAIGIDIQYAAAPQFHDLNFFGLKTAIQLRNGDVTNNFGHLVFAASAAQFTNVMFNNVCQAVTMPEGNGTVAWIKMTNVDVWGDQSGFACSAGKPMFQVQSNDADISLSQVNVYNSDSFMDVGCGQPGTGNCRGGNPGSPIARLSDINVYAYSEWTPSQFFLRAPSNTEIIWGANYLRTIRPQNAQAGAIVGPGLDGTTARGGSNSPRLPRRRSYRP